jgi:hypothetical protein
MIYRKHVQHQSPKNFQLDLFSPDDGHFEYYAVATNLPLRYPRSTPSSAAAAPRRRRSPNSRARSRSPSSRRATTAPTVPGSNSASSPTTSPGASSSTLSPPLAAGPASARTATSGAACGRYASCCHPGGPADPHRWPQCPAPRPEPGDRSPLRPPSTCARGLSCSENPGGSPRAHAARSSVTRYPWRSSSWTARRVTRSPCRRSK